MNEGYQINDVKSGGAFFLFFFFGDKITPPKPMHHSTKVTKTPLSYSMPAVLFKSLYAISPD